MNKIKALAVLASVALGSSALANTISGTLTISGSVVPNGANLNQSVGGHATGLTSITPQTASGTGDFVGFLVPNLYINGVGSTITYQAFSWQPSSLPINSLWTITPGVGESFSFDLKTLAVSGSGNQVNGTYIDLTGTGVLHGSLHSDTIGTWSFHADTVNNSSTFNFHDNNATGGGVPDGGATAMLIGAGILGLGALRRKLA